MDKSYSVWCLWTNSMFSCDCRHLHDIPGLRKPHVEMSMKKVQMLSFKLTVASNAPEFYGYDQKVSDLFLMTLVFA